MHNGGRSWYHGRRWNGPRDGGPHRGMRHNWDNGRYGAGFVYQHGQRTWAPQRGFKPNGNRSFGNRTFGNMRQQGGTDSPMRGGNRSFGTPRESSTRSTVNRTPERSFGSGSFGRRNDTPRETFKPQQSSPSRTFSAPTRSSSSSSFGGRSGGSFGNRGNSGGSFGGGGGSFGRRACSLI